jgi:anti-sigma-K factor RskA
MNPDGTTNPMDHAEAHEWIADLAIEPGRLAALRSEPAAADVRLLEHVAVCETCRADLASWADVQGLLADALARDVTASGSADAASIEPIPVPAGLRDRVLSASRPRATPVGDHPTRLAGWRLSSLRPGGWPARAGLALAAAIVVLVGVGTIRDQQGRLDTAHAEQRALAGVMAALDRVLTSPSHDVAVLQRADGGAGGTVSWSGRDIVVLTTALQPPATGQVYRCWLEQGGQRTPIGRMDFAAGTAYWSGSLDEWAKVSITAGSRLGVSLESTSDGSTSPTGSPVLLASLGS